MGIILLFISLLVAVLIAKVVIFMVQKRKNKKKKEKASSSVNYNDDFYAYLRYSEEENSKVSFWKNGDDIQLLLTLVFITLVIVPIIIGMCLGGMQYRFAIDYKQIVYLKQMLEERVGNINNYDDVAKELLYNEITEFNNRLREIKYVCDNPMTSWFGNWKAANIDYIIV